jgi:amino acid transporter
MTRRRGREPDAITARVVSSPMKERGASPSVVAAGGARAVVAVDETAACGRRLRRGLGLLPLAAVVFFNVSGGPYGIEDMVPAFGPGLTLVLLILTPLLWSLPVSLAMSELASAMPDEGGYVTWTARAFGPFWAFQVGWWSWIDSFVDVAVYPALFVDYVKFWYPTMTAGERWLLALGFIVVLTALNLVGVRPTGRAAVVLGVAALAPMALFVALAITKVQAAPWTPITSGSGPLAATFGLGLSVAMWNYSGWDTPSTCLGETQAPERAYRLALFLALPVITAAYLFPVGLGLATSAVEWSTWSTATFPRLAQVVGGAGLGHLVAGGAMVGAAGQFMSLLLTNSRLPYVLARDGLMPPWLGGIHARFGTPWPAILVSAFFYAGLAIFSFKELVVLTMWLYSLALIVELAAFVWLRVTEPSLDRPWRVPGGLAGAVVVSVAPSLFAVGAMVTAGWGNTIAGLAAACTGPAAYWLGRRR